METFAAANLAESRFAHPQRILVATDLTDAEYLIPHVVAQAKANNAHVTLVHAILPLESFSIDAGAIPPIDPMRVEEEARLALRGFASQIKSHDIPCDIVVRDGIAPEVIRRQVVVTGANRLIMATHGRGRWGQLVLGSVANQLLGSTTIPIFAVGPNCHAAMHATPRRILHPVSMTGEYRFRVKLAIDMATSYGAELTLLHIPDRDVEKSIHPGCTLSWAENLAEDLVPEARNSHCPIHISVAFGSKVEEIRKEAERIKADWIVVGVQEEFFAWPLGENIAYRVMAAANCPVFAIPASLHTLEQHHAEWAQSQTVIG